jgi:hypothetical protein
VQIEINRASSVKHKTGKIMQLVNRLDQISGGKGKLRNPNEIQRT